MKQKDLNDLFKHKGFNAVWAKLKGHGPARWQLAVHWCEDRIRHIQKRPRSDAQDAARWQAALKVYGKHLAKARKKAHKGDAVKFKRWMLNGHPGNIEDCVKRAIARVVTKHDNVYVTATTDGTHAIGSYHYPANNPNPRNRGKKGRAADFGGTNWYAAFQSEKARGCSGYLELFGPQAGYIKNGVCLSGTSPDVPNHTHDAPMESN